MYILTFCPQCNHIVTVDKYGMIECSRCHKCFLVDKKKKQKKLNFVEFVKQGKHKPRDYHGYFLPIHKEG